MFFSTLYLRSIRARSYLPTLLLLLSLLLLIQCAICTSDSLTPDTIPTHHAADATTSDELLQATHKWLKDSRLKGQAAAFGVAADHSQIQTRTESDDHLPHPSSNIGVNSHGETDSTANPRPHKFGSFPSASTLKVFGVGLSKTGTTSLHMALQSLGLKCIHFDQKLVNALAHRWLSTSPDLSGWYDDVDCVSDIPTAWHLESLMAAYPNAKFIATHREVSTWYSSFTKFLDVLFGEVGVPLLHRRMHERVYGTLDPNEEVWTNSYIKHYERVKQLIPSQQLLWLEMSDLKKPDFHPFARVCNFLSISIHECKPSDATWPRVNTIQQVEKRRDARDAIKSEENAEETSTVKPLREFAYATFLSGAGEKSDDVYRSQYLTAAMVWCQSVRATYPTDEDEESRHFDMVLLTLDSDLSESQLRQLRQCFNRIIVTPVLGRAPGGTPDMPVWSRARSKFAVFSLTEYRRVIAMDANHVVVKNLDAYFFRWFYEANERNLDARTDIQSAVNAAHVDAASGMTSTPRMLYAIPHSEFPIDSNLWSLQPSKQIWHDLSDMLNAANFNRRTGWNDYGPVSTPDPSTLWAPRVALNRAAQLHATPSLYDDSSDLIHPWYENSRIWHLESAWSEAGLALYYFYLLTPELGGFVNPEDAQQSFIHYLGSNKPWLTAANSAHLIVPADASKEQRLQAEQWADAMDYWQQLASKVDQAQGLSEHENHRKFSPTQFQSALSEDMRRSLRFRLNGYGYGYGYTVMPPQNPHYTIATTQYNIVSSGTQNLLIVESTGCAAASSCIQSSTSLVFTCSGGGSIAPTGISGTSTTVTYTAPSTRPSSGQDVCTLSTSNSFLITNSITFTWSSTSPALTLSLQTMPSIMQVGVKASLQISTTVAPTADTVIHMDCTSPITSINVASIDFTIRSGSTQSESESFTPPTASRDYLLSCVMTVTSSADTQFSALGTITATPLVVALSTLPATVYVYATKVVTP